MSSNLIQKLDYYDYSDFQPKDVVKDEKNWTTQKKQIYKIICELDDTILQTIDDKINTVYDKYLKIDGDPNYEEGAKYLKAQMEKENGPTWICMIGKDFSFNVKTQKNAFLYCYCGDWGILLYKC